MKNKTDKDVIVIKKYPNRRLYDTSNSRYVNMKGIGELIKQGARVEVIDGTSGEDITKVVLTQIIMEEEKEQHNLLPTDFLHQLIQHGEAAYAKFAGEVMEAGMTAYRTAQGQIESAFSEWLKPWALPKSAPREEEKPAEPADPKK